MSRPIRPRSWHGATGPGHNAADRKRPRIDGLESWADLRRFALELVVLVWLVVGILTAIVELDAILNAGPS